MLVPLSPLRLEFFFANHVRFGSKLFCLYGYEIGTEQCVLFSILSVTCCFHSYTVCLGLSLLSRWSVVPVLIPRHPPMALPMFSHLNHFLYEQLGYTWRFALLYKVLNQLIKVLIKHLRFSMKCQRTDR